MKGSEMGSEQPTCMGCMVNPGFNYVPHPYGFPKPPITLENIGSVLPPSVQLVPYNGLTDGEREVLNLLKEAWQKFVDLGDHISHDLTEFNYAIHLAQQKMAIRVARRVDPDVWSQPAKEVKSE